MTMNCSVLTAWFIWISQAAAALTIFALPFCYDMARFEPYDPHRAGLLAVLVALAIPGALRFPRQVDKPILLALILWVGVLLISTVFSISPTRALFGDLIRRMGLLTQLLLMTAVLIRLPVRLSGRIFWATGAVVSVTVMLQAAGVIENPWGSRAAGVIGAPVFTGGWLALAVAWSTAGWPRGRFWQALYGAGLLLMIAALFLTGARGALVACAAGIISWLLAYAAVNRTRWLALLLSGGMIVGVVMLMILLRVDWGDSILTRLPLISRLNPALPDSSRIAREIVLTQTLDFLSEGASLNDVHDQPDRYAALRRFIGFGLESFETRFRPSVTAELRAHESGRPIDRAHNDWLDTWTVVGLLGVAARLILWAAVWRAIVRRLGLPEVERSGQGHGPAPTEIATVGAHLRVRPFLKIAWRLPMLGGVIAFVFVRESPYLPITMTLGLLAGCWVWLLWCTFRADFPKQWDTATMTTLTALAVLSAHLVDLQFSFTSVLTGWAAWLAVGLLLENAPDTAEQIVQVPILPIGARHMSHPRLDSARFPILVGLSLIGTVVAAVLWMQDISADRAFKHGLDTATRGDVFQAANTRTWDDRLWLAAAGAALGDGAMEDFENALDTAVRLNPYDGTSAYLLAVRAMERGEPDAAENYFAAAARLMPGEPYVWREWARFRFYLVGDDETAMQYVNRALQLDPNDTAAQELHAVIQFQ